MVAGQNSCTYPVTATDATGEEITIEQPPERIVSLNPSAAQTLWEIGAQEKVVGVSQFAGFLEGASELETVTSGFPSTVDVETVISLEPDLVFAPNTIQNETVDRLRESGTTVFRFSAATSIEDVYEKTRQIGRMAGACDGAEETIQWMKTEIEIVREAVAGQDPPNVLYAMSAGYAPSPNTFIGGMIDAAGGHNIVANLNTTGLYPQLSSEVIVQQNPEWIIAAHAPGNASRPAKDVVPISAALRNTSAWTTDQIVTVDRNNISQPAPRIVYPIRKMAQAFHPEAYAEAAAIPSPSPTLTDESATEPDDSSPTPTETDGQPGFGLPVAVLALAIVTYRLRRRQGV